MHVCVIYCKNSTVRTTTEQTTKSADSPYGKPLAVTSSEVCPAACDINSSKDAQSTARHERSGSIVDIGQAPTQKPYERCTRYDERSLTTYHETCALSTDLSFSLPLFLQVQLRRIVRIGTSCILFKADDTCLIITNRYIFGSPGMSGPKYELFADDGYTARIYRIRDTRIVCKDFTGAYATTHFPVERHAYELLTTGGGHPNILTYHGIAADRPAGVLLDLAEKGTVARYVWEHAPWGPYAADPVSPEMLYRWARQATEGLAYAHSCGVMHSDVHCANMLLDEQYDLKISDFAGASMDGNISKSFYRKSHTLPGSKGATTVPMEIFGLGSALYNMVSGHDLFPELHDEDQTVARLCEKQYPDVSKLPVLGSVVLNCWNLRYESMGDVVKAIEREQLAHQTP